MAEKYFVYYQVDSAAPYPVVTVEREDDQVFLPDEMYNVEGWTKGTAVGNYNHAIFDSWYDEDGETTVGEWFVTPGSPPTRTTTNEDNLSLEERQALKQLELDQLVADVAYTQLVSAKITSTLRADFKDYIEELQGISNSSSSYYQSVWATNPEGITLPTKPTYVAGSTTTEGQIASGDILNPNSVGVLKQFIPDRETLQPEWGFEVPNLDDFTVVTTNNSGTIQFLGSTINRSGGYCLALPSERAIELASRVENAFSVGEGDVIVIEALTQYTSLTNTGSLRFGLRFFDQNKAPISVKQSGIIVTPTTAWASRVEQITVDVAGAKWASVYIIKTAGTTGSIRIDAIKANKVISLERLPTIPPQTVIGRGIQSGDGPPEVLGPQNLRYIIGMGHASGLGVGDSVTQGTSKSTAVTLNSLTGQITTHNESIPAGAAIRFNMNNNLIGSLDMLIVNLSTISSSYRVTCAGCAAGAAGILIENRTGGALAETLTLNFAVVKGAVS